ncbi:Glycosyltransferase, catalytic subunit of cellulose synthase and poly-beta-1,6-N-acetylglucosamine synthase [Mariniphaga anaerophila]|uniref:Glycosyltransferase, catalytic subunit of cellulose synthase and poly-beta-1,6-N-acetylglucosamine synthase n=1 Tax=Mariniphaga anaerophila TaxID=1484053 RepID=A0A1M4SFM9_9BACT|nr:glycosyltransferase family 2 protein [Mariniphaga anaerophila]SHE31033.1 Glycosyltransferase, catalytic subunit of cellulose synthase and poly-beta-1,6-N-acetylglucosamine synthase [Mariniphaga anaerophila]
MTLNFLFWIFFFVLVYTYLGYPLVLYLLTALKKQFSSAKKSMDAGYEPDVCLFVTAYNEKDFVGQKVENSFELDYPKEKVQYVWVTDGSDDGTPDLLRKYEQLEVYHEPARRGKMHAMNRGMQFVKAPIVIFSDTNTRLNKYAVREIVACFSDPNTGCVAGEKRIVEKEADVAAAAGEGMYWKFESWVKKMDAELNSAVGAVGELFAIRRELFEEVESDTVLDDFIISLRIAQKGYRIAYTPNAYAEETASLNVKEELKRKVRIAAGGVQTFFRLKSLLNPFRFGVLSWQYFSHKVLRWTLAPISLFLLFFVNGAIVLKNGFAFELNFYSAFFLFQILCYILAVIGWYLENKKLRFKIMFVPYYFVSINYAAIRGIFRYFRGKQSASWEKSKRAA